MIFRSNFGLAGYPRLSFYGVRGVWVHQYTRSGAWGGDDPIVDDNWDCTPADQDATWDCTAEDQDATWTEISTD